MATTNNKKMQPEEALELQNYADEVYVHDHLVGRALRALVYHVAHAHGVDVSDEQEKARRRVLDQSQDVEDQIKAENDRIEAERAEVRANLDPQKEFIPIPIDTLPSQQPEKQQDNEGANR